MSLPPDLHNVRRRHPRGTLSRLHSFVILFLMVPYSSFILFFFLGWAVVVVVIVARLMCFVLVSLSLVRSVRRLPSWQ